MSSIKVLLGREREREKEHVYSVCVVVYSWAREERGSHKAKEARLAMRSAGTKGAEINHSKRASAQQETRRVPSLTLAYLPPHLSLSLLHTRPKSCDSLYTPGASRVYLILFSRNYKQFSSDWQVDEATTGVSRSFALLPWPKRIHAFQSQLKLIGGRFCCAGASLLVSLLLLMRLSRAFFFFLSCVIRTLFAKFTAHYIIYSFPLQFCFVCVCVCVQYYFTLIQLILLLRWGDRERKICYWHWRKRVARDESRGGGN